MNLQDQKIAILKACGWKFFPARKAFRERIEYVIKSYWLDEKGMEVKKDDLPTIDLDFMHEAEKLLTKAEQQDSYVRYIHCIIQSPFPFESMNLVSQYNLAHATVEQHLEAFLRTKGLWTD